jgi:hypothetical protein
MTQREPTEGGTMAQPRRVFDIQLELLNAELVQIGATIRSYDAIAGSLKVWTMATWAVALAFILKESALHEFIWIAAVLPLVMWLVDASFRSRQRTYLGRERDIAEYMNSPVFRNAAESGAPLHFPLLEMRRRLPGFENSRVAAVINPSTAILYVVLALCSLAIWASLIFERRGPTG